MEKVNQKAVSFISRLLSNPTLQGLTPLQKEEQLTQFLLQNIKQLYPTLSSPAFFPGMNWENIWGILIKTLYSEIDKAFQPMLKKIIIDEIDLAFIPFLREQSFPTEEVKEVIYSFLEKLLKKSEARRAFTGPFSALAFKFYNKYVDSIFNRKEYIHFELVKVQRLRMSKEELKNMIAVSILLNPAIHFLGLDHAPGTQENKGSNVQSQFAAKVLHQIQGPLGVLPEQVLKSAVNSNVSFTDDRYLDATARITALFVSRCKNYNPGQKIDRGADTADKSWFNVARRNYKFFGFDLKMLDELYKIATENGW